ncbi:MAG: ATP-dependent DNA ligase [Actinomycetes bacterium]
MLLAEVADAVAAVTATTSRREKTARLAAALSHASPTDLPVVVRYLAGELPQRRTGLGWRALQGAPSPADAPSLTVAEADAAFAAAQDDAGPGSQRRRRDRLHGLLARATPAEQRLLGGLVTGELRQGAQRGVLTDAVAVAAGLPVERVRRAVTLSGDLAETAVAALAGGAGGLSSFGLQVGRPLSPMLAQSAPDLADALDRTGPAGVEWKLDGVRVQMHRDGDDVALFTRSLDDITPRLPEVVEAVRALPVRSLVADGEVLALAADGRPLPFQQTAARVASQGGVPLSTVLFDVLHVDGEDVLDEPGVRRRAALVEVAPALAVPRTDVIDPADAETLARAEAFMAEALSRGHEGVVVKSLEAPYAMGRRGAAWVKVKPRVTFDLVVLAAEWGHGRRTGHLSNLHLGARDPEGRYGEPGGFVMLGKTFKGLTDAMLAWQTRHLLGLAVRRTSWRVDVRPELVVEIAVDGVQTSPRYPAGMALRFARVLRHRPDKAANEADTVEQVAALHVPGRGVSSAAGRVSP